MKYQELGSLNLPEIDQEILKFWEFWKTMNLEN